MTITKELKACIAQDRSLELVKNHLVRLEDRISERLKDLALMDRVLEKEHEDIVQLEKMEMRSLFQRVLGADMEAKIAKEREEFLMAVLKHKDILKSLELMRFEQKILMEKVASLPQIKARLKSLLEMRKEEVMLKGGVHKEKIIKLNRQIDEEVGLKREVYEAKIATAKVKQSVSKVLGQLQKAVERDEWKNYHQEPKIKKDSVQEAQEEFYKLKILIQHLEDELYDIYQHRNLSFLKDFVDVEKLAKQYHKKLIVDWQMVQQIRQSKEEMNSLLDRTERMMVSLEDEDKSLDINIAALEREQKNILINDIY